MKKVFKKLSGIIVCLSLILSSGIYANAAEETSKKVDFTTSIAKEIGINFARGITGEENITADNVVGFYNEKGLPAGYIVHFYQEGNPYGYVILDTTEMDLVTEFSFDKSAKSPYEVIVSNNVSTYDNELSSNPLYKLDSYEYGVLINDSTIINNYGEMTDETVVSSTYSSGKDPTTWDEPLLDIAEVYEGYSLIKTNHLNQFYSYNEPMIENLTGHYACAVSALLACASHYQAVNYKDLAGDYMDLWNMTNTTVDHVEGNITYGGTTNGNIGTGFVNYCSDRGVTVGQTTNYEPSYSFFTNFIDRGDIGIVMCGIIDKDTNERSGHAMAVEGYATLKKANSGSTVHTLMVFDGWGDNVRYLNIDFDGYSEHIRGVAFNG